MHGRLGFHEPGVRILIVNRAAERNRVAGVIVQAARRIAVFMQVSQRYLPTLGRRIGGAGMILPRLFRAALGQRRIERVVELPAEPALGVRSEEHTSELQSLMRISYAVFCLKKKITTTTKHNKKTKQTT